MSWIKVQLDELVESNVIGLVKGTKDQSCDHTYEYVKMNNITSDGKLDLKSYTRVNATDLEVQKYSLEYGDLLFNTRNSAELVGKSCIYNRPESMLFNNNIMRLRFNKGVDSAFIQYQLYSIPVRSQLKSLVNSTTNVAAIYYKNLINLELKLPPLPVQERIAAILDAANALRQKDQALLKKYDTLTQSIFLEMFGDPVSNPKGWEKKGLGELGTITTGNTPSRNVEENFGNYIEWIKTDNINTPNIYLTKSKEYLSNQGLKIGRSVGVGAILVTCIAGSRRVLGNVAIADRKVAFNQQINAFTPHNENPMFWYYQFILAQEYVQNFSTNGMKGMISKGEMKKIQFIMPTSDLINEFSSKILLLENQKLQVQANIKKSEALFQSLLQRAFKGDAAFRELVSEEMNVKG